VSVEEVNSCHNPMLSLMQDAGDLIEDSVRIGASERVMGNRITIISLTRKIYQANIKS